MFLLLTLNKETPTQLTFTCSKSTRKTLGKCMKYVQINNENTSIWYFRCYLWTYFAPFSSVFIFDFEQVNVSWVMRTKKPLIKLLLSLISPENVSGKQPNSISSIDTINQWYPKVRWLLVRFYHVFKVSNKSTSTSCEICSKLTIKDTRTTPWASSLLTLIIFCTLS